MITATFDRIGGTHTVPPLTIDSDERGEIAEKIYNYARPRLGSRDVEVYVDLDKMTGGILCGVRSAGRFTLEREPEQPDEQEIAEVKLRARDYREIILQLTEGEPGLAIDATCPKCDWGEMSLRVKWPEGVPLVPPVLLCRKCGHAQRTRPAS